MNTSQKLSGILAITIVLALAPPAPSQVAPAGDGLIRLNMKDAPFNDVLSYLSEAAGFTVTIEAPVPGNVTVMDHRGMNSQEVLKWLNNVLVDRGFVAILEGRNLNIISMKTAGTRGIAINVGSDPEVVPKTQEVTTQIIPLQSIEALKFIETLKSFFNLKDSNITSSASSNAIIMTDTKANIHKILEFVRAIDSGPPDTRDVKIFELKNADAREVAEQISSVYSQSSNPKPMTPYGGGSGMGGGSGGGRGGYSGMSYYPTYDYTGGIGSVNSPLQARVNAVPDPRTNSIIIIAPRESIEHISNIIAKLDDSSVKKQKVYAYPLQYGDGETIAALLNGIFSKEGSAAKANVQNQPRDRLNNRRNTGASPGSTTGLGGSSNQRN